MCVDLYGIGKSSLWYIHDTVVPRREDERVWRDDVESFSRACVLFYLDAQQCVWCETRSWYPPFENGPLATQAASSPELAPGHPLATLTHWLGLGLGDGTGGSAQLLTRRERERER